MAHGARGDPGGLLAQPGERLSRGARPCRRSTSRSSSPRRASGTGSCAMRTTPDGVRFRTTLGAFVSSIGANAVLPARVGEALRVGIVRRRVPGSSVVTIAATIVLETAIEVAFGSRDDRHRLARGRRSAGRLGAAVSGSSHTRVVLGVTCLAFVAPRGRVRVSRARAALSRPHGGGLLDRAVATRLRRSGARLEAARLGSPARLRVRVPARVSRPRRSLDRARRRRRPERRRFGAAASGQRRDAAGRDRRRARRHRERRGVLGFGVGMQAATASPTWSSVPRPRAGRKSPRLRRLCDARASRRLQAGEQSLSERLGERSRSAVRGLGMTAVGQTCQRMASRLAAFAAAARQILAET